MSAPTTIKYHGQLYKRAEQSGEADKIKKDLQALIIKYTDQIKHASSPQIAAMIQVHLDRAKAALRTLE
jgi:hypothetical protein